MLSRRDSFPTLNFTEMYCFPEGPFTRAIFAAILPAIFMAIFKTITNFVLTLLNIRLFR